MAGKRQATSDLNHDNWDREEEPEERGTFRAASDDELKNRVIKKAKRKIAPGGGNDTPDGSNTKSVFSGFSGFGKPGLTAATTASSSPFSFLSKIPAVAAATSGVVSSSTTTASALPTFSFGGGSTPAISTANTTESTKLSSTFAFGNSAVIPESSTAKTSAFKPIGSSQSSEYHKKLVSLNQAVCKWIKTHVDKNPVCILSPIFKDYEKFLKEIEDEKNKGEIADSTASEAIDVTEKPSTAGIGSFTFSSSPAALTNNTSTTTTSIATETVKTNGFSFGSKKSEDTSSAKTSSNPSFSFGIKPSSAESSTISSASTTKTSTYFSFGNLTNNTNPSNTPQKPFSFTPSATPFSFGNIKPPETATTFEADANEDEDEEPPKNEFKQVVEDDAVYSKKCKVFVKKDGNFVDKGVGTLYLKPVESSGKTQLLVRADTNLGNILVNLILNSSIPAQRMGKNNVMLVCLPTPDVEKPTSVLLRVKTGEEADELLENIDKYKK